VGRVLVLLALFLACQPASNADGAGFAWSGGRAFSKDEQLQENKEAPAKESELTFKNYDEQMVRELRELCRARGLPSNGTKAELKAALAKDDEERRPVEAKAASRANVKLLKSDGTELDLDGKMPLDAGSSSKNP
ncbi:unnamed protein product, partial [Symbiodinium sp. CCMP2456]